MLSGALVVVLLGVDDAWLGILLLPEFLRPTFGENANATDGSATVLPRVLNPQRRLQARHRRSDLDPSCGPLVDDVIASRLALPFNTDRCHARTFGLLQCTNTPLREPLGVGFCRVHFKSHYRHGVVGSPVTSLHMNALRDQLLRAMSSVRCVWYSRDASWKEAMAMPFDSVASLSDAQWLAAVVSAHGCCHLHPHERAMRGLEPHKGPQCVADRGAPVEACLGQTRNLFPFYAYPVFLDELPALALSLGPGTATEKQFMTALHAANARLRQWRVCRDFETSSKYCGRQSSVHLTDSSRMLFVPWGCSSAQRVRSAPLRWKICIGWSAQCAGIGAAWMQRLRPRTIEQHSTIALYTRKLMPSLLRSQTLPVACSALMRVVQAAASI